MCILWWDLVHSFLPEVPIQSQVPYHYKKWGALPASTLNQPLNGAPLVVLIYLSIVFCSPPFFFLFLLFWCPFSDPGGQGRAQKAPPGYATCFSLALAPNCCFICIHFSIQVSSMRYGGYVSDKLFLSNGVFSQHPSHSEFDYLKDL